MDERTLHIFILENAGCSDMCIAYDAEDARAILEEIINESFDDYAGGATFEQWPDDQPFSVTDGDEPGHPTVTMLPAEWAAQEGRGYLGGWV